jgi:hypothetical protein
MTFFAQLSRPSGRYVPVMTEGVAGIRRKPTTLDEYEAPIPQGPNGRAPQPAPEMPWLKNPDFGGATQYPPEMFSNASAPSASGKAAWPVLPPLSMPLRSEPATAGCSRPFATPDNASSFVERGIGLRDALKDGAFGSTADLERFIDQYTAQCAARPDRRALYQEALTVGPEIVANRIDADERDLERAVEHQRMGDRVALMQLRPPLPIQQRAAVGEVAIPIARAVTFVGKFVPVAGDLIVLAEVVTGRDLAGLGEKLDRVDRAVDAALLVAPFAAKALGKGARGAAELLRVSRATGRSVDEARALCRTAIAVEKHRAALREGIANAKAGRPLTDTQRAAVSAVADAMDGVPEAATHRKRTYKPTLGRDASLPAGGGGTDKYGNILISPHGTAKDRALAHAHESVHSFFSPKAMNRLRELRANVGMAAYEKSALCKYIEEALAESYAQVKVNGIRALPDGLTFPIRNGYVTLSQVLKEAADGTIVYGGILYAVYVTTEGER